MATVKWFTSGTIFLCPNKLCAFTSLSLDLLLEELNSRQGFPSGHQYMQIQIYILSFQQTKLMQRWGPGR